jgi:hypothetical protein
LLEFNEAEIYRQIFEKCPNIKFHENSFSESRVVSCGLTDRRTDRYKEADSRFQNFANAPTNTGVIATQGGHGSLWAVVKM